MREIKKVLIIGAGIEIEVYDKSHMANILMKVFYEHYHCTYLMIQNIII